MADKISNDDTNYESSDCGDDESKDDTSYYHACEGGLDSDEGFENNTNYISKPKTDNNNEVAMTFPEEEFTIPEGEEHNVINVARNI